MLIPLLLSVSLLCATAAASLACLLQISPGLTEALGLGADPAITLLALPAAAAD